MPSLDGYTLNHKMDRLNDDMQCQIDQLKVDFRNLYTMMEDLKKENKKCQEKKHATKSQTQKQDKTASTTKESTLKPVK